MNNRDSFIQLPPPILSLHKEVLAPQKGFVQFLLSFVSFALCSLGKNHKKGMCSLTNKTNCSLSFQLYTFYVNVDS